MTFARLTAIGCGGFIGAGLRFFITDSFPAIQFPWTTLFVNSVGCLLIAFLYIHRQRPSLLWQDFLQVGFCGSFTTVSLFQIDFFSALQSAHYRDAFSYFSLTLLLTFIPVIILILLLNKERQIS